MGRPGLFYRRSKSPLHSYEDSSGPADGRLYPTHNVQRVAVNSLAQRSNLAKRLERGPDRQHESTDLNVGDSNSRITTLRHRRANVRSSTKGDLFDSVQTNVNSSRHGVGSRSTGTL